jgi:hypothetical protein
MFPSLVLGFLAARIAAVTAAGSSGCIGTISSLNDVSNAVKCTTVNINAFTVPAGQTFALQLLDGTTVNVCERDQMFSLCTSLILFSGRDPIRKPKLGRSPIRGQVSAGTATSNHSENLTKTVFTEGTISLVRGLFEVIAIPNIPS